MSVAGAMADPLEIVSFAAGAFRFAVEARQIDEMLSAAPETFVAVETLLGLPFAERAPRRCLRVGACCVEVSEPLELRPVTEDCIYPLPELVAARIQIDEVRGLVLEADGTMLLLDLRALLARNLPLAAVA